MNTHHIQNLLLFSFLLLGLIRLSQAACNQTLSTGTNVASAISSAAAGTTICLNSGSYGRVNLFNIARSAYVIVRSTSGKGASIAPQVGNTDYVRFESLTISESVLQNSLARMLNG